jgi:hypothetical protein
MDKRDAEGFTILCRFMCYWPTEPNPLVLSLEDEIYSANGLTFAVLSHLASVGLVHHEPSSGFVRRGGSLHRVIAYADHVVHVEVTGYREGELRTGSTMFTALGRELAKLVHAEAIPGFPDYVVSWYCDPKQSMGRMYVKGAFVETVEAHVARLEAA